MDPERQLTFVCLTAGVMNGVDNIERFLQEKIPFGMVPFVQATLLARHLRGDLESYPSFLWK